jgi:ammonia channel protein AmtB
MILSILSFIFQEFLNRYIKFIYNFFISSSTTIVFLRIKFSLTAYLGINSEYKILSRLMKIMITYLLLTIQYLYLPKMI